MQMPRVGEWWLIDHMFPEHVICATRLHTPDQTNTCLCMHIGGIPVFDEDII